MKVIITGVTGMVGEGVLDVCLQRQDVEEILVINRKPCGVQHTKLKEIIHADFYDLSAIESSLEGYDACLFCLGVTSVGMDEPAYYRLTCTLTMHVAQTLVKLNANMSFCYISGAGTDSSENGRLMWARVKGKTENDLMKLPFKQVYNFRPAILRPTKGLKNILPYYAYFAWLLPVINLIAPNYICTLKELGSALLNAVALGYTSKILEVKDIKVLAKNGR